MVLKCEIGTAEGKPQVEEYGLEELAASAEAVLAGLGPLVVSLAGLVAGAGRAVTLDAMEGLAWEQGMSLRHPCGQEDCRMSARTVESYPDT